MTDSYKSDCGTCDHESKHRWEWTATIRSMAHALWNPGHTARVSAVTVSTFSGGSTDE